MSFGRRVELMRRVRELAKRTGFLAAGEDSGDKMDAGLLHAEIERLYFAWGGPLRFPGRSPRTRLEARAGARYANKIDVWPYRLHRPFVRNFRDALITYVISFSLVLRDVDGHLPQSPLP